MKYETYKKLIERLRELINYRTKICKCNTCLAWADEISTLLIESEIALLKESESVPVTDEDIENYVDEFLKTVYTPITKREVHELLVLLAKAIRDGKIKPSKQDTITTKDLKDFDEIK